jgi:tetratricopeptide (TPR) repeat protein
MLWDHPDVRHLRSPLVERREIRLFHLQPVRRFSVILAFCLACPVLAEDSGMLLLEEAYFLETAAGDLTTAEQLYKQLPSVPGLPHRSRAEATFRRAELCSAQSRNDEAKKLYLQVLRDFPEADDLIPLAEDQLTSVTTLLTHDHLISDPESVHHVGDLVIALEAAMANGEKERADELMQRINSALETMAAGSDAPRVMVKLKESALDVAAVLSGARPGGIAGALAKMRNSREFEPFLRRGFPSDPHDLFAPAWRLKDRLARAVARNEKSSIDENALALERYLAPLATLPEGPREGALARLVAGAIREIRDLAAAGKFSEARQRLQEFDLDRHEKFPDFRPVIALPQRLPGHLVSSGWAVTFRSSLAVTALEAHDQTAAAEHVMAAIQVCRDVQPAQQNAEIATLFARQLATLETALAEIHNDQPELAKQELQRVAARPR